MTTICETCGKIRHYGKECFPEKLDERELDKILSDHELRSGFLAMFAGCISPATVMPNGHFFCGKAECEWIWPHGWEKLRDLGLIEYRIEDVTCYDGAIMKKVHLTITERGENLRDDWWK